jgi:hypothetical protein
MRSRSSSSSARASQSSRPKAQVSTRLDKNLIAYATAAGAAGVAMLAAVPPAAAEIVYTHTHVTIGAQSTFQLDLNHDGVVDFELQRCNETCQSGHGSVLHVVLPVHGNQVLGGNEAGVVPQRGPIGPGQQFTSSTVNYGVFMATGGQYDGGYWFFGAWANQTNQYLGLKFLIDGQVHYGWARMTVTGVGNGNYTAVLSGYAYETTPNKGIPAGLESGPDAPNVVDPTALSTPASKAPSLGMLARGADGLALWRREQE